MLFLFLNFCFYIYFNLRKNFKKRLNREKKKGKNDGVRELKRMKKKKIKGKKKHKLYISHIKKKKIALKKTLLIEK